MSANDDRRPRHASENTRLEAGSLGNDPGKGIERKRLHFAVVSYEEDESCGKGFHPFVVFYVRCEEDISAGSYRYAPQAAAGSPAQGETVRRTVRVTVKVQAGELQRRTDRLSQFSPCHD